MLIMYEIKVRFKNKELLLKTIEKKILLDLLRENVIDIPAPCGGKGRCGKCIIQVIHGTLSEPSDHEQTILGKERIQAGYRLSCMAKIVSDCSIIIPDITEDAEILTDLKNIELSDDGIVNKLTITLNKPAVHDQKSDLERLESTYGKCLFSDNISFIADLPKILRSTGFQPDMITIEGQPADLLNTGSDFGYYGIAVDVGTTTVAVYLYDFRNNRPLDRISFLNPQRPFGADVISRIDSCIQSDENLYRQNYLIIQAVNDAVDKMCKRNGIINNEIYTVAFVGNTTMMHLLMKIPPVNIAASPFIPVTTMMHRLKPKDMNILINPNGLIYMLPCISGYVGADTIGAIYACSMHKKDSITIMCDIGTNGEIVLGDKNILYSCSTAAGPAFEGANIKCGIGGISGAIDTVKIKSNVEYTTIGGKKPIGICGSGIVDVIAQMLDVGIIDYTGRIVDIDEIELPENLCTRIITYNNDNAFIIEYAENSGTSENIIITQKDVRELQNAKAAITAGILTLIDTSGHTYDDIEAFYLAGGFGNYLKLESACKIGLIPKELEKKVIHAGNAAGAGALMFISMSDSVKEVEKIKALTKYIELSSNPDFTNRYIDCMFF